MYGFTQAKRGQDNMHMGEVTDKNNVCKWSPGPIYNYQDKVKYNNVTLIIE